MAKTPHAAQPKKGDHVFLVDGSGYIFRAYHALPPLNRKSDGLQVNAVLGFCNMLWKLLREMKPDERPTHLAVIFDKSEQTFRTEFYPEYKANRSAPPDDLIPQFALIREAVRAFDIPCLEQAGYEADDLIATYIREACELGADATIVSSDKDLMQLVNDCVIMYDTMKDKKIGIPEVIEKFGVPPEKVIEVQALIGDSTDNVPGVPGIGVKTAAQLISEFGDLETLLARAGEIKQEKRRQSLIDNADKARLSKRLVTLDPNVKLEVPLADLAVHEPDYKLLIAFLKAMEFNTLTRRVAEFSGIEAAEIEASQPSTRSPRDREADDAKRMTVAVSPSAPLTLPLSGGGMAPKKKPGGAAANIEITPQALEAERTEAARKAKFDRSRYEIVNRRDRLEAWVARARDVGVVAINAETVGEDPMQATICG
ncbi:MAG: DNA polymerase I, partial [Rhizobiales bacterium]|nr:DNA polymerase I [Hyphomicrobiales bacterium]